MKVVIIGGVAAGMSAASKLKRNRKDQVEIMVYEKGGEVSYGACGIPFYISDHIKLVSYTHLDVYKRQLGETRVGREHMVTETLSVTRDPEKPFSIETGGWNWQNVHVETDSTLPDDTLVFQVEYNEMAVTPYIEREKSGMNRESFFLWSDVNGDLEVLWECKDEMCIRDRPLQDSIFSRMRF